MILFIADIFVIDDISNSNYWGQKFELVILIIRFGLPAR